MYRQTPLACVLTDIYILKCLTICDVWTDGRTDGHVSHYIHTDVLLNVVFIYIHCHSCRLKNHIQLLFHVLNCGHAYS